MRYYRLPADVVYRIADNMSLEDAAMVLYSSLTCPQPC